ncbi:MAG: S1C family serine protease [Lachnospiraceae bacterium]|nr:S1C family serine protease [Lachnospiraceae bacterium]
MITNNEQNDPKKTDVNHTEEGQYSFIKETRKKRPIDRSDWIKRAGLTLGFSVVGGLIAALVFALCAPSFLKFLNPIPTESEKIEIATVSASSEEEEEEKEEETKEEKEKEEELTPEDEQELAIQQYVQTYKGLMNLARDVERSMVEVIGITSQMDYFNHDYENRQSVSGLLIAESNSSIYCLTENRGLKKAEEIQVIFFNGARAKASVKGVDKETNLAVLAIDREELDDGTKNTIQIAQFGSSNALRVGSPVIAVGSITGLGDSMEFGMITSLRNTVSLWDASYNVFSTDMIGNSVGSGVLVNIKGQVVGIISQNLSTDDQNLISAIPIQQLSFLIETLINGRPQVRIGIKGQNVSPDISDTAGIPEGVLVTAVDSESPAMFAGIKELDVITAVAGNSVENLQQYENVIAGLKENEEITVSGMRLGTENYEEISFRLTPEIK